MIPTALRPILADPTLRLVAAALVLVGAMAATVTPYQSLLAVTVFGMNERGLALLLVLASAVAVTSAVGAGILTDRTARRRRLGLIAAATGAVAWTLMMLWPGRGTFVLAHGVLMPLSASLYGQLFALARLAAQRLSPADRGGAMAAVRALFALPFIVILPLWGLAFARGATLAAVYPVLAALAVALTLLLALRWPADGGTAWVERPSGLRLRAALRELAHPEVLSRVALVGGITAGNTLYMTVIGLLFDATGRGPSDVALFAGIVAGLEVPVMLSMGRVLARFPMLTVIVAAALLYAGFLLLFPLLAPSPLLWLLTLPAAMGAGVILSLPLAYLQDLMSERPGTGSALMAVQKVVSDAAAASIFAAGTFTAGYGAAAGLAAAAMATSALLLLRIDRRRDARAGQAEKNPGPA